MEAQKKQNRDVFAGPGAILSGRAAWGTKGKVRSTFLPNKQDGSFKKGGSRTKRAGGMSESKSYAPTNRPHDQHANIRPHSKNAHSLKRNLFVKARHCTDLQFIALRLSAGVRF